jgi:hypothetical protein
MQEGKEEERGGSFGLTQEVAEAAAPEADIEEGLLEGLALFAGEGAVGAEGAIEDALGGGAGENEGEGVGGDGSESSEGGPGLGAQASEWIQSIC